MLKRKALVVSLTILVLVGCAQTIPGGLQTPEGVASPPSRQTVPRGFQTPQEVASPSGPAMVVSSGLVEKLELEDLITAADTILVGAVAAVASRWNDDHTAILTEVQISVEERLTEGPTASQISLVVPGGEVGETTQLVEDTLWFAAGERVLLFMKRAEDGALQVMGGFQGKLTIEDDLVLELNTPLPEVIDQIRAFRQGLPPGTGLEEAKEELPSQTPTAP